MAAEPTVRDALIAEMLGDIGKLHDAVDALKGVLPGQIEAVETTITGLIGLLQKAGDAYKGSIEAYTNAQGGTVRAQMEKDAQAARDTFDHESRGAIKAVLTKVEQAVINTVENEVSAPMRSILWAQKTRLWNNLVLCLCAGMLGGIFGAFGSAYFVHDKRHEAITEWGNAVVMSWDKLDSKSKALINAARSQ